MALLEGKVVVVTGGGRGIGREHCLDLARQGAAVVVADAGVAVSGIPSSQRPEESVVREIESTGGSAIAVRGSVIEWSDCEAIIETTLGHFGRLDAIVNNAGILRDKMITTMSEEDFDSVVAVHLKGTFQMTKLACLHWRSRSKAGADTAGRIINTASGAGLVGNLGQANYAAAKAGVVALTLVTALEMAHYGVTCNAICPVAATRMTESIGHMATGEKAASDGFDPLHPCASSPLVSYLVSSESAWLNGQILRVEGNTIIRMQGWEQTSDRYTAKGGAFLEAEELVDGMRLVYRTIPRGLATNR